MFNKIMESKYRLLLLIMLLAAIVLVIAIAGAFITTRVSGVNSCTETVIGEYVKQVVAADGRYNVYKYNYKGTKYEEQSLAVTDSKSFSNSVVLQLDPSNPKRIFERGHGNAVPAMKGKLYNVFRAMGGFSILVLVLGFLYLCVKGNRVLNSDKVDGGD